MIKIDGFILFYLMVKSLSYLSLSKLFVLSDFIFTYDIEFNEIAVTSCETDNDYITDKYSVLLEKIIQYHQDSWL